MTVGRSSVCSEIMQLYHAVQMDGLNLVVKL